MRWAVISWLVAVVSLPVVAEANERRFAYTYESAVLGPGQLELEPWTTLRAGRTDFYRRFDERLEFEFGITERLQSALYLNVTAKAAGPAGQRENELEARGQLGVEAQALGSGGGRRRLGALPGGHAQPARGGAGGQGHPRQAGRGIDRRLQPRRRDRVEQRRRGDGAGIAVEGALGLGYLLTPRWSVGVEVRSVNLFEEDEVVSALYLGPTIAYASQSWWAALSLQPQVVAFSGASPNSSLDLEHNERFQGRLVLGFHL
ncbi:MAG: hypothetical protein QM765_50910 [Myxococcales bacterium]